MEIAVNTVMSPSTDKQQAGLKAEVRILTSTKNRSLVYGSTGRSLYSSQMLQILWRLPQRYKEAKLGFPS